MTFFLIFFRIAHLHIETQLLYLSKFHIFSRSEKSWGEKVKRYIDDGERTDDERRRTTWTIIIPRQDSQNPRANKLYDMV